MTLSGQNNILFSTRRRCEVGHTSGGSAWASPYVNFFDEAADLGLEDDKEGRGSRARGGTCYA